MHTVAVPSMISTWFSILYQPPYATDNTMLTYSTWSSIFRQVFSGLQYAFWIYSQLSRAFRLRY